MGLVQTAIKGYWRHFRFSCSFCVTNLPIPHAFFRHGPVFVLFIINFFDIQQGPFLWSDKFENDF